MNRICPSCERHLEVTEYFFCSSCGSKLDEGLISYAIPFSTKITYFAARSDKIARPVFSFPKINEKVMIAVLLVLTVILSAISIFHFTRIQEAVSKKNIGSQVSVIKEPPIESPFSIKTDLQVKEVDFSKFSLAQNIPYEVDFFLEGSDFFNTAIAYNDYAIEGSSLEKFVEYITGPYAIFGNLEEGGDWQYAILFSYSGGPSVIDEEETSLKEVQVYILENLLVLTATEELITQIGNSSKGIAKNVTQRAEYGLSKSYLDTSGQVRFMNFNDTIDEVYSVALSYSPNDIFLKIMDDIKEKQLNKFVITK